MKRVNDTALELMLSRAHVSTPRRTPAAPNSNGTLAIYNQSIYDLHSQSSTIEWRLLNLRTGESSLFTSEESIHDVTWIGETNLLGALKNEDDGTTRLIIGDGANLKKGYVMAMSSETHVS